jgi:deazaflavin-dependent oxidoreductase (nitroreductase family)
MTYFTPEETKIRDEQYRVRSGAHVERYLATNGAQGYDDNTLQAPTLLLTTTGRKSGKTYTTPLNFAAHEGRYLLIASYGGSDANPKWYLNLVANPEVHVQVKADRFRAIARTADGESAPLAGDGGADAVLRRVPRGDGARHPADRAGTGSGRRHGIGLRARTGRGSATMQFHSALSSHRREADHQWRRMWQRP